MTWSRVVSVAMVRTYSRGTKFPSTHTLAPLPHDVRAGLTAITVLAAISFVSAGALFIYLTYKLLVWRFVLGNDASRAPCPARRRRRDSHKASRPASHFGLNARAVFAGQFGNDHDHDEDADRRRSGPASAPNQFFILVYNLFLADMHQGLAFLLSVVWLGEDALVVGTPTCWAQGLLVSTGDLSASVFALTIAIHTYLSVVNKSRPSQRLLYSVIIFNWVFVYFISLLPVAMTRNGADDGGFFVRAGAWCWINADMQRIRLGTHYLFILLTLTFTTALYLTIFISLRRQQARARKSGLPSDALAPMDHNPAFLIYPIIYVACTLPLAIGRIVSMAGNEVSIEYYCFAGSMIAFNGSFDCLLFGTTRSIIIFGSTEEISTEETGLSTFTFLKTPNREFGNMVWIQGGSSDSARRVDVEKGGGGWWSWASFRGSRGGSGGSGGESRRRQLSSFSQESLGRSIIQMDMVTSVVVETEGDKRGARYGDALRASNATTSAKNSERTCSATSASDTTGCYASR